MIRRSTWAALVLAVALVGCSSGGSDGKTTTTTVDPKVVAAFAQARKDPCSLLTKADVVKAIPGTEPEVIEGAPLGGCRYRLSAKQQIDVDLYRPLTKASLRDRRTGTAAVKGGDLVRLSTPGSGMLVHEGNAGALVAIRSTDTKDVRQVREAVRRLAKVVRQRLPEAPAAGDGLADQDLCAVIPRSLVGKEFKAADGRDPNTCAYQAPDGTLVTAKLSSGTTVPGPLARPWSAGGKHATWQPSDPKSTASGLGLIPVKAGTMELTLSSPVRNGEQLERLAARLAARIRRVDHG